MPAAPGAASPPTLRARVGAAVDALRRDPNLGGRQTVRTLHWVDRKQAAAQPSSTLRRLLHWLAEGFRWIAALGRALILAAVVVLVALLAVYLLRSAARRQRFVPPQTQEPPEFVRGLDIRPESLPEDVGAAALALWRAGGQRAALALLYRGLLSRAVHVQRVPIRDSSTEGDCLRLCAAHCATATQAHALRLVRTWELAVYRGQLPEEPQVASLCAEFAAALAIAPPPASAAGEPTAVPA
ncbi:MAG: hypothetical protein U1F06_05590 [Steroidobacteraceae bacterium]